jgi:hypothetical protein
VCVCLCGCSDACVSMCGSVCVSIHQLGSRVSASRQSVDHCTRSECPRILPREELTARARAAGPVRPTVVHVAWNKIPWSESNFFVFSWAYISGHRSKFRIFWSTWFPEVHSLSFRFHREKTLAAHNLRNLLQLHTARLSIRNFSLTKVDPVFVSNFMTIHCRKRFCTRGIKVSHWHTTTSLCRLESRWRVLRCWRPRQIMRRKWWSNLK